MRSFVLEEKMPDCRRTLRDADYEEKKSLCGRENSQRSMGYVEQDEGKSAALSFFA
ncbi:MAG TPA: hypothetical protein VGC07_01755 [Granulicella sp.]